MNPDSPLAAADDCTVCGTANPPAARFCAECGGSLEWTMAERRIISVLFADLAGFTGLTEKLDAEQVHALITVWLDPLCEVVARWGGHVDKFIGDCVMALFGAPVAYENEPERAVRAALDMQAAFNEEAIVEQAAAAGIPDYRPRLSIGVNTGPVVTGMFSSGGAWDYTAIGDTVNVAARLQGLCGAGQVLVGEVTYEQTRHLFEFGSERVLRLKGRDEPVRARTVAGVRTVRGETRGFAGRRTPLIGRTADLARLREAWRRAEGGSTEIMLLLGAAGIGKSRLVAEFVAAEGLPEAAVARGRSYPYASSTPWEPIAELIRDLHGIGRERSAPEAVAAVTARAPEPWSADDEVGLGAVLGSPAPDLQPFDGLAPAERHEKMVAAVTRAIREGVRKGASEPKLLIIEDVHWADRTTLGVLQTYGELDLPGPLMLVLISRPPLPAEREVAALVASCQERIELAPLTAGETTDLIDAILGAEELPAELLETIHARSGGNPLFIEEILKAITADGDSTGGDGGGIGRSTRGGHGELEIPDSIDSVITTRIDKLEPAARKVLQYAAIVGSSFWPGVVGEALARRPVDREMDELVEAAIVKTRTGSAVAGETEYAFEHLLVQEVAYAGLLNRVRAELHGTVARWFEQLETRQAGEYDDWIAFHFERSGEPAQAVPYLEKASTRAWEQGALRDAEALIDRALAVADAPADRVRLNGLAEEIATATGDDDRRLAAIERLTALGKGQADAQADARIAAEATFRRARRLADVGELDEARRLGREALDVFSEAGDGNAEADALRLLGRIAHVWGAYDEALAHYRSALPLERHAGDRHGEAEVLRSLGLAEADFGHFTRALEHFDQALGVYAEIRHRPGQATALANRATTFRWLGRYAEAEEAAARAEEIARGCGSPSALAEATLSRAHASAAAGRVEEARTLLRQLLELAPDLRRPALEARAWLALAELETGDAAIRAVRRAREVAAASGLIDIEVFGPARLAELALSEGDLETADAESGRAIALLERHGDVPGPDEVVYYTRSRVLSALGHGAEAAAARERAREIIRRNAELIEDEDFRRSFLENVAPNPEILATERVR